MGCDGGTIPRRDELVRQKKKPEQKDKTSELSFKWRHCALTQEKLQAPIVACGLGRLYNKQALIEALISKTLPESFKHIKNLKDVKDVVFFNNPVYKKESDDGKIAPYSCPITALEMNGNYRFVFLWTCACVLSERALKQIKTQVCVVCQKPFVDDDVVVLNGTEEDVKIMQERHTMRRNKAKEDKQSKKSKNTVDHSKNIPCTSKSLDLEIKKEDGVVQNIQNGHNVNGIKIDSNNIKLKEEHDVKPEENIDESKNTPSTSKSLNLEIKKEDGIIRNGHNMNGSKINSNNIKLKSEEIIDGSKPPSSASSSKLTKQSNSKRAVETAKNGLNTNDPLFKKAKTSYSVAKDPNASSVYKSLFTSHESEKKQERAHWVTYNPFYN